MSGVRAHLTKGVRMAKPSDDGKYGLLGFERERPDNNGDAMIWIGVPVSQLPNVAVASVKSIPQPEFKSGYLPAVFRAESVLFGTGPDGQLVLTLEFQEGASLSLELDEGQARGLAVGIENTLGPSKIVPMPPGTRPS